MDLWERRMLDKLDAGTVRVPQDRPRSPKKPDQPSFSSVLRHTGVESDVAANKELPSAEESHAGDQGVPAMATSSRDQYGFHSNAVLEMHLVSQGGRQELVSLPWRLIAGWSLAHAVSKGVPGDRTGPLLDIGQRRPGIFDRSPFPGHGPVNATIVEGEPGADLPATGARPWAAVLDLGPMGVERAPKAIADAAALSADSTWQARLIRLIERQSGGGTAWVRDYRLSDDELPAIVHRLRQLVEGQGWVLERVMVNAREVWNRTA